MTHRILLFALVLALFVGAHGCSLLKRGAFTGGGAAGGAALGSLAGPVGTVAGAAVGGIAGQAIGENEELRDGSLVGEGAAKVIYRDRSIPVPMPFTPWRWIIAGVTLLVVYLRWHKILNFVRGGGIHELVEILFPKRTIVPKKPRSRGDALRMMEPP